MSSSSKKKRPLVQQCGQCGCCFLAKDFEAHFGGQKQQSPAKVEERNKGAKCCLITDYRSSGIPMTDPGRGLALREQRPDKTKKREWEEGLMPEGVCGWSRRHAAVVHPETMASGRVEPRSAVICEGGDGRRGARMLITLWPNPEVAPMRIVFPRAADSALIATQNGDSSDNESILHRLTIVPTSPLYITKISLRPQVTESKITPACWAQLAKLSHFQSFIRSYFTNAPVSTDSQKIELFYYGHSILFQITEMEIEGGQEGSKEEVNSGMEELGRELGGERADTIRRISPMCKFYIDWGCIKTELEEELMKEYYTDDGDGPESLR